MGADRLLSFRNPSSKSPGQRWSSFKMWSLIRLILIWGFSQVWKLNYPPWFLGRLYVGRGTWILVSTELLSVAWSINHGIFLLHLAGLGYRIRSHQDPLSVSWYEKVALGICTGFWPKGHSPSRGCIQLLNKTAGKGHLEVCRGMSWMSWIRSSIASHWMQEKSWILSLVSSAAQKGAN